ncbi:shikimate kinase [Anaerotignum sp.]|nr:shikimate kinase [Anaerotignum sp.]MBQ7758539.1 shikimate dehydrogenase [Anaerotignum sp.]
MRYGLIGEKLGHSFSKIIHEQLADYTYDLIPLTREELDTFMTEKKFSALNVTIPYKETVIPYLDEVDAHAQKIGAVNTIVNRGGKLKGYNTDFYGFRYMLQNNGIDVAGKKALVLGKGGASKAIIAVLEELGASEILTVYYKENPATITYEECYKNHSDAEIIVNTTPVGMYPKSDDCPIDLSRFPNLSGIADVVYNPLRTQLILEAEKRGINAAGGLEMLVAQAKYAVEIFLDTQIDDARIAEINTGLVKERSNLVLVGMSGCGKTTLGKLAAEKLGKTFVDTDEIIVERIGMPISDFFAKEGEPAFRAIETEVQHEVSNLNNAVISTGGGIVKNPLNVEYLRRNGRTIWLKREGDLLQSGHGRPLAPDQAATLKLYQERIPLYTAAAEAVAENSGTLEEGLEAILAAYEKTLK